MSVQKEAERSIEVIKENREELERAVDRDTNAAWLSRVALRVIEDE